jgi:hypothetical protein
MPASGSEATRACLSLFGRSADPHRLLADHLTSEYAEDRGRGRTVYEWNLRVDGLDIHC